jgi:hypothetical protein
MTEHDYLWLDRERPSRLGVVEVLSVGDLMRITADRGSLVLECHVPPEEEAHSEAVDLRAYWDSEGPFAFLSAFEHEQLQAWCVEAIEGVFAELSEIESRLPTAAPELQKGWAVGALVASGVLAGALAVIGALLRGSW